VLKFESFSMPQFSRRSSCNGDSYVLGQSKLPVDCPSVS